MKNILIIRSTGFQHLDRVLARMKEEYPQAEITLLTHEHGKALAAKYADIKRVVVYPYRGSFSILRSVPSLGSELFDLVVIPVSNERGNGFFNVRLFSLRLQARSRALCTASLAIVYFGTAEVVVLGAVNAFISLLAGLLTGVSSVAAFAVLGVMKTVSVAGKMRGRTPRP